MSFTITFARTGQSFPCEPDTPILTAAISAGLRLPHACASGMCGTCKSKLISGEVDMVHAGGIRLREIAAGMFLPCCSKPKSDIVFER